MTNLVIDASAAVKWVIDEPGTREALALRRHQLFANIRGITATALRAFLTRSHPKMPNLMLTQEETADVIAYILSLRNRPPS